jgi:Undecaprenyl-phosphate galactose phosphotransferase WbaP
MLGLRFIQVALMIIIDLAAFYVSMVLAILLRIYLVPHVSQSDFFAEELYWDHLNIWWIPLTLILTMAYESLYQKRIPFWQETWLLIKAISVALLIVLAFVSLGKLGAMVSRVVLVSLWVMLMVAFPLFRHLGKKILSSLGLWHENVLILGAGDAGRAALRGLEREVTLGYNVIGFLDDDVQKIGTVIETPHGQYRVFGPFKHFKKFVHMMKISTIIIAVPGLDAVRQARIVSEVQRYVSRVLVVPELKGIALLNTELCVLFMEQLFLLKIRNNLKSLHARIIKRCFDFVVSSLVIVFFAIPLLIIFAMVRLTSKGKAFYIQHRPGKDGKIIRIYKFRSMYVDGDERLAKALTADAKLAQEWKVYRKLKSYDPRVTLVGKFLRKWSLDELPQIFNVWKGQMSIVGPRPYIVNELESLREASDIILMAKPGLCGLWQASGRNNLSFDDRVKLETWYVLNWSLWLDVILMFKTAKVVLTAEGAY